MEKERGARSKRDKDQDEAPESPNPNVATAATTAPDDEPGDVPSLTQLVQELSDAEKDRLWARVLATVHQQLPPKTSLHLLTHHLDQALSKL